MKKLISAIGICALGLALIIIGCETQAETFDEFTRDGETVYIGTPDTVIVAPLGVDQSRFFVTVNADPKISKGKVLDLNEAVVHEFNVDRGSLVENTLQFDLNLEEGDYSYKVVLEDDNGNSSIQKEVTFRVFGIKYQQTLLARTLNSIRATSEGTELSWGDVQAGTLFTTVAYEDLLGVMQSVEVSNEDDTTVLADHKLGTTISVMSSYKPTDNSLSTFPSSAAEASEYQLDKSLIEVVTLAGDVSPDGCFGFPLANLFDGTGTMWHSCGGGTPSDHPFVQTFDLGVMAKLSQLRLFARQDCCQDRSPARFQIWGTDDIAGAETVDIKSVDLVEWEADAVSKGWVKLTEVDGNSDFTFDTSIPTEGAPEVRYFRMVVLQAINGGDTANYAEYTLWAN
ncbi:MAG: DUF4998 domain-containing protein [Allomuricauda sp.]